MHRNERDERILEVLACKVRFLSLSNVVTHFFADDAATAKRRLAELSEAGYVESLAVLAGPFLEIDAPVARWSPAEPAPNHDAVAWQLQRRWPDEPPVRTTIFRTTPAANRQYGGPDQAKPLHPEQLTHDLHVTLVYLHFRAVDPVAADAWIGEDLRPKAGHHLADPDATLEFANGRRDLVIEFGGRYDARRVREFHDDCAYRERAYELW